MPLIKGKKAKTRAGFSENVRREMESGKKQSQAVAIAYSEAGEKKEEEMSKDYSLRYKIVDGKYISRLSLKNFCNDGRCSVQFCPNEHYSLSYCCKHYQRLKRHDNPLIIKVTESRKNERCKIKNCFNLIRSLRLCNKHYLRFRKYGNANHPVKERFIRDGMICKIDGCNSQSKAKMLCGKHYMKLSRYGDPLFSKRNSYPKDAHCIAIPCKKNIHAKGLCSKHYQRRNHPNRKNDSILISC